MNLDYVEQQVSLLNPTWYKLKKDFFQKETFYNKSRSQIFEVLPVAGSADEDGNYISENDIVIDVSINRYCWDDYFPYSFREQEHWDKELPINSGTIVYRIVQWIENTIDGINDNSANYRVILSVVDAIKEQIEIFSKENAKDEDYIAMLDDFFIRFRNGISEKFRHIKKVHLLSAAFSEKERLTFNINQEKLGALLYILYGADIIYKSTPGDTSFLNYCQDRFYFRNQKTKSFTKATDLRNKFNDAKKPLSKARDSVIKTLKDIFKEL